GVGCASTPSRTCHPRRNNGTKQGMKRGSNSPLVSAESSSATEKRLSYLRGVLECPLFVPDHDEAAASAEFGRWVTLRSDFRCGRRRARYHTERVSRNILRPQKRGSSREG